MTNWRVFPIRWKTHFKIFKKGVPQLLMNEWVSSKLVKRHCMNFSTALASLACSLYNHAHSYSWNCILPTPVVGSFFVTLQHYHRYLVASLSKMAYAQVWLVNDKPSHILVGKVRCRSIGLLKVIRKAHRSSSRSINQSLRDWSIVY